LILSSSIEASPAALVAPQFEVTDLGVVRTGPVVGFMYRQGIRSVLWLRDPTSDEHDVCVVAYVIAHPFLVRARSLEVDRVFVKEIP